jgi:hypothetical protein
MDNTIPQITEGTEWTNLTITPTSATSKLIIDVILQTNKNSSGQVDVIAALFQGSTADAIAVASTQSTGQGSNGIIPLALKYVMTSGTTIAITFHLRIGSGSNIATINTGNGGASLFGGKLSSSITIMEVIQ